MPAPFLTGDVPTDGTAVQVLAGKLRRGTNLFLCVIHTWMHANVTLR